MRRKTSFAAPPPAGTRSVPYERRGARGRVATRALRSCAVVGPLVPGLLLALYAGFAPVAALVCIGLLAAPHSLRRSAAYVAGSVVALVVIATAGAALFDRWAGPGLSAGLAGFHRDRGAPSAGRQVVSVGIGVALLVLAAVRWRGPAARAGAAGMAPRRRADPSPAGLRPGRAGVRG